LSKGFYCRGGICAISEPVERSSFSPKFRQNEAILDETGGH
jgi:hypothetical protein